MTVLINSIRYISRILNGLYYTHSLFTTDKNNGTETKTFIVNKY